MTDKKRALDFSSTLCYNQARKAFTFSNAPYSIINNYKYPNFSREDTYFLLFSLIISIIRAISATKNVPAENSTKHNVKSSIVFIRTALPSFVK